MNNNAFPSKSQLKKTLRSLRERLQGHPMDLDARMRVARTYRLLDEKKDAVAHYRTVARYLSLAGRPLQAVAVLKELLQIAPKHEDALLFLAKLYARTRAADPSNTGHVAVPILDDKAQAQALAGGMPLTKTGIWRAIRPQATDLYALVQDAAQIGAEIESADIDRELNHYSASHQTLNDNVQSDDEVEVSDEIIVSALAESARYRREAEDNVSSIAPASTLNDDELLQFLSQQELVLPRMPLFSSLPPAAFIELSKALELRHAPAGDFIFEEGEAGDSFLVLLSGEAQVLRKSNDAQPERELYRLKEGDFAGLFALMSASVRAASVRAVENVEYLEIKREALDKVALNDAEVKVVLAGFFRERLLLNLLSALPLFSERNAEDRAQLVERFIDKKYEKGDEIFFEGTDFDGLWVILEGKVQVLKENTDKDNSIKALLCSGDFVGSLAGSSEGETQLSALASTDVTAALFPQRELRLLAREDARFAQFKEVLEQETLLLSPFVYAGNGRIPGTLSALRKVF